MYISYRDVTRDQSLESKVRCALHAANRCVTLLTEMLEAEQMNSAGQVGFGEPMDFDLAQLRSEELKEVSYFVDITSGQIREGYRDLIVTYNRAFDEAEAESARAKADAEDKELSEKLGEIPDEDYDIRPRNELSSDGSW